MRILVVDDNATNRKLLHAMLEAEGHQVITAEDGVQALGQLDRTRVDAIISDILMPNMDGYRFCHAARLRDELRTVPFIFATSTYTSPDDEKFALELGADRFLRKPVAAELLAKTLRELTSDRPGPPKQPGSAMPESEVLAEYSQRLVAKLEEKNTELAERKIELESMAAHLESSREQEALRISRDIHDQLGQALTALNIDACWLKQRLTAVADPALRQQFALRLETMTRLLEETAGSVQRICAELRPALLDDLGLSVTLHWLTSEFQTRTAIQCQWLASEETKDLTPAQAVAVFRIFQEILTNVARHAAARRLEIALRRTGDALVLTVADDGKGFDKEKLSKRDSMGLSGMRERALLLAGRLEIRSRPGQGTVVELTVPLSQNNRAPSDSQR